MAKKTTPKMQAQPSPGLTRRYTTIVGASPKRQIILMADVIGSSRMPIEEMESFFQVVQEINTRHNDQLLSCLTVTLGDEFQGVVRDVPSLIDILIDLEETLLRRKSQVLLRYVAKMGEIDTQIHHQLAHAMVGPGLTAARESLEAMKNHEKRFEVDLGNRENDQRLSNALYVWGSFIQHWKAKDKHLEIIPFFLEFEDYKLVAERSNSDRGNVWRLGKSLRFNEYLAQRQLLHLLSR
jgi:SatD family (SatD)